MKLICPSLKIISTITLSFFIWSFGGIFDIANAISNSDQPSALSNQPASLQAGKPTNSSRFTSHDSQTQRPEANFQKTIEGIEQILSDTATDTDTKKNKLKTSRAAIEALDVELRKQFAKTENFLKDKGLPNEILDRHYKFVKHYDDNLKELKSNLDAIDKAKTNGEANEVIETVKGHLEKVKPPKKHKKLDPNRLPHQIIEPVTPLLIESNAFDRLTTILNEVADFLLPSAYAADMQPYDPANLGETAEITLTQEIHDLSDELGGTPVDLYEFVRNGFRYDPYAGSLKGAVQTLREKDGNEWDLASLLIALLRARGIPARYVVGDIRLPIEQAMDWLGVENPNMAGRLLMSNGRPTTLITSGGKITALQTRHVWVQAYILFLPSRGAASGPGDTWVNIDPSFKSNSFSQALSLSGVPEFNQDEYLSMFRDESTYDYFSNQLQEFLTINAPGYKPEALMRLGEINPESFGVIIGQLPYTVKSVLSTYSEVPDSYRQKFTVSIAEPFTGESQLFYTASLPQIIGKRLTLSYQPATNADQATIDLYGSIFSTPPYLIKLIPVIKLEGVIVAQGSPVGPGDQQSLTFIFENTMGTDRIENTISAGEYYAIGLNAQTSGQREQILDRIEKIKDLQETINFSDFVTLDDRLGEVLYLSAMVYHQNLDSEIQKASSLDKVVDIRQVSEIMYFMELKVDDVFGVPGKITPIGISADMDRDIHLVIPVDGDTNRIKPYMQLVGNLSSYFEHAVTEGIYQTQAISAVKAIQLAHDQGIPVHLITSQNINTDLPSLQVADQVKADIINAVNAGKEAIVPERNVTLYDWRGVGYIIQDPNWGSGAYMISGGLGGSMFVISADLLMSVELMPLSTIAAKTNERTIKGMICFPGSDNMLFSEDDTCYTAVDFGDIQEDCGKIDPGCRGKYAYSHSMYAQPLIDYEEPGHNMLTLLSKNVTAWHWQSQDNARYMRAGYSILFAIEHLMTIFNATQHNIRIVGCDKCGGSAYRTQDRNEWLRRQGNKRPSRSSHHMDGVAADIKLAYANGTLVRKCEVLNAADLMIYPHGEVRAEDTPTTQLDTVHIAVMASPGHDTWNSVWRCK